MTVCLAASVLSELDFPGYLWTLLAWARGFQEAGCRTIWLEVIPPHLDPEQARERLEDLRTTLNRFGLANDLAVHRIGSDRSAEEWRDSTLDLHAAAEADLLLNQCYALPAEVVRRFRRTALLDIDPGLLQLWVERGWIELAPHDLYFTIGETVGTPDARFPDCGLRWIHVPPAVCLSDWPVTRSRADAPYTTISNWWGEWMEDDTGVFNNEKRTEFLRFIDLPSQVDVALELAIHFTSDDVDEQEMLENSGWRIRPAQELAALPPYADYIRRSRGEFSCAKPSCMRLQNAWFSDRTLCYLASGKPAVVQNTGPSRYLPEGEGLFRFTDLESASRAFARIEENYEFHCAAARRLAGQYFDARRSCERLLNYALN